MKDSLNINLADEYIVLRAAALHDDAEPAVLSGDLCLKLSERASIKDISLVFSGRAKMTYSDGTPHYKTHSNEQPLFFHNFSFLPEHADHKDHTHTLNAGNHSFPFSVHLPPDLPASLRTFGGSGIVEYRLKAAVTRPGFSTKLSAKRTVHIVRGLGPDAIEYNATVDLENTWPDKIMYRFTLPHKAFAASSEIPVSILFTPLAKGVRVLSINTEIRETTTVIDKAGNERSESHPIYMGHKELTPGSNQISRTPSRPGSQPLSRTASHTNVSGAVNSLPPPPEASGSSSGPAFQVSDLQRRLANVNVQDGRAPINNASIGTPQHDSRGGYTPSDQEAWMPEIEMEPEFNAASPDDIPPQEIRVVLRIPAPDYASPTNVPEPVQVVHRIKWACLILNADGHTSELRCALPIMLMDKVLKEEIALATSGSRNLLFGPSGALLAGREARNQADLPSYQDHVLDRLPNPTINPSTYEPNPWASSTSSTPNQTPAPSRPSSPTGIRSNTSSDAVSALAPHSISPDESVPVASGSSSNLSRFFHPRRAHSTLDVHSTESPASSPSAESHASSGFFAIGHSKSKKGFSALTSSRPSLLTSNLSSSDNTRSGNASPAGPSSPLHHSASTPSDFYSTVPSYDMSSQFANGGIVPLESIRSLPSYEQVNIEARRAVANSREPLPFEHI